MEENKIQKEEIQKKDDSIQVVKGNLQLRTINDLWRTAQMFVQSGLCPQQLDTPQKVVVALQAGAELGFKPWQSLQSLHVINGRVGLEGCAMLALIRKNKSNEYITCSFEGKPYEDDFKAVITSKRRDEPKENVTDFSVADAKLAKLWGAKDNWSKYPKDMLTWRAVSRHCRRYYSDEISGMYSVDELDSIESQSSVAQPIADEVKAGVAVLRDKLLEETPTKEQTRPVESTAKDTPKPETEKPKKGRPKGSKNRPKETATLGLEPQPEEPEEIPEEQTPDGDKLADYLYVCQNPKCGRKFDKPLVGKDDKPQCPSCFNYDVDSLADQRV